MTSNHEWLSQRFGQPKPVNADPSSWPVPPVKAPQDTSRGARFASITTDAQFRDFLKDTPATQTALVEFGSAWCVKCHEVFPKLWELSSEYTGVKYGIAQVEYMQETAKGVKYSPTFAFFQNGKKVDEIVGSNAQKLENHLWLHSDNA